VIQVLVIAPTLAVRTGLRALIEVDSELEVFAETPGLDDPAALPSETDVVLVADETLDWENLAQVLEGASPLVSLLALTDQTESAEALTRLPVRAWGLLPLDASAEELTAAIHAVYEGLLVGAPTLLLPLMSRRLLVGETAGAQADTITNREAEVLELLAQGLANKQIAAVLTISEHTVKFHVSSIYSKLGATNRAEAVRLGARLGLIVL
jgi:DNA-binding NarL/FixJ family response regulator